MIKLLFVPWYPSGLLLAVASYPSSSVVILLSLPNSDNSKVTTALTRTVFVFSNVYTELRRRGPPSLLRSDNSAEALALSMPDVVIIYFAPLQLSLNFHGLGQCLLRSCELDVCVLWVWFLADTLMPASYFPFVWICHFAILFELCIQFRLVRELFEHLCLGPPPALRARLVWTRCWVVATCSYLVGFEGSCPRAH